MYDIVGSLKFFSIIIASVHKGIKFFEFILDNLHKTHISINNFMRERERDRQTQRQVDRFILLDRPY